MKVYSDYKCLVGMNKFIKKVLLKLKSNTLAVFLKKKIMIC